MRFSESYNMYNGFAYNMYMNSSFNYLIICLKVYFIL